MPKVSIPKSELDKNFKLYPVGWYPCLISLVEYKKTNDGKKNMYVFTFTCIEGEAAGAKFMRYITEDALGFLGPILEALKAPKNSEGGYDDIDPMACMGQNIDVHNIRGKNDKNGKDTNELDDFRPFKGGEETVKA